MMKRSLDTVRVVQKTVTTWLGVLEMHADTDDFITNVSALRREPSLQGNGFALVSEPLIFYMLIVPDGATVSWVMAGRLLI